MSAPTLEGCHAKLRRAYQHLDALHIAVQTWGKANPYTIVGELHLDTGEHVLRITEARTPPVVDWGIIVGDALHNLRATLDYLVCVMIQSAQPANPCRGTGFPILSDEGAWAAKRRGRLAPSSGLAKLGPVDDWTIATIRGLQPFTRRKEAREEEPLWILNELVNTDKQRTLNLGTVFLYQPEVVFEPPEGADTIWVKPAGPFKDGDALLRYRLTRGFREDQVKTHTKYEADIVFKDRGPAEGTKIDVMLAWLFDTVVYVVDLFDHRYFGGRPPAGTMQAVVSGEGMVTREVPGSHSNSPEAKRARWLMAE